MDLWACCSGEREDVAVILLLIAMQLLYGSFSVFAKRVLSMGLSPHFVVIVGGLVTAIIISPAAFFLERGKRPSTLSPSLLIQFLFISVGQVTVFESLLFSGIRKTSPAIATAMPNLVPSLVFIIAWFIGLEKVNLRRGRSWAKIVGTFVCLGGTLALAFPKGPPISHTHTSQSPDDDMFIGCMYLLVAVFAISCVLVLQAATLVQYPAPVSLCALTYFLGSVSTAILHVVLEGGFDLGWSALTPAAVSGVAILRGLMNGIAFSIHAWGIKKKGPVIVSAFSPITTIWSGILSTIFLGNSLSLGSIIGTILIFIGLYLVLWGKNKDKYALVVEEAINEGDLLEKQEKIKPLLG
ncbi:unnamed protein product [Victoria cruziana]